MDEERTTRQGLGGATHLCILDRTGAIRQLSVYVLERAECVSFKRSERALTVVEQDKSRVWGHLSSAISHWGTPNNNPSEVSPSRKWRDVLGLRMCGSMEPILSHALCSDSARRAGSLSDSELCVPHLPV